MARTPSPLMTPREVADVWHVTPRTVKARLQPGSAKRNRVEPLYTSPDVRWDRAEVYADLDRCKQQRSLTTRFVRGREQRRLA